MKKCIIIFIAAIAALAACDNKPDYFYRTDSLDNIYFNFPNDLDTAKRNMVFSFAYAPAETEHILEIPVKISGVRTSGDRYFNVVVDNDKTTAEEGLHYEALQPSYKIAANTGEFMLPVKLLNTDPEMESNTLKLALKLVPSDDFTVDYPYLTTVNVSFSNRLEKPEWWDYNSWASELGAYSRNKHFLFLVSSGVRDLSNPETEGDKTMASLHACKLFKAFIADPISWVAKNPEYVFEDISGGSGAMFQFYEVAIPDRKIMCITMNMGPLGTKYAFFDDNNAPTIYYT